MELGYALGILGLVLCAALLLKRFLIKTAYGYIRGEANTANSPYPYQAILQINGVLKRSDAKKIKSALGKAGVQQAETDVTKQQIIVQMKYSIDDAVLSAAIENVTPYSVLEITRI